MIVLIMQNIWRLSMISEGFKKQLIVNSYNTQLLSEMDIDIENTISTIKRTKNLLLFKSNVGRPRPLDYKYKDNIIDYDILWFLTYLTSAIYSIYNYSEDKKFTIKKDILHNIKNILENKRDIDNRLDYAEYLENIYD